MMINPTIIALDDADGMQLTKEMDKIIQILAKQHKYNSLLKLLRDFPRFYNLAQHLRNIYRVEAT